MEYGKHVIFYRIIEDGIRVSRILHQSMRATGYRFEDRFEDRSEDES